MENPSENGGGMRDELRSDVEQVSSSAKNRIHSEVDARKGTAANQAKSVSSALERASSELDQDSPQWLKSAFQQSANQIQRFAETLEQKDSREIMEDVRNLARDNPGTFLAGCAALGFAAARVFKAGGDNSSDQSRQAPMPPVQREEPMFRPVGAEPARSPSTTGEFA